MQEPTDRAYWEDKGSPATVKLTDHILSTIHTFAPGYELKYNKHYIGLALHGQPNNFVVFLPRRAALLVELKLPKSDEITKKLEEAGLEALEYDRHFGYYKLRVSADDVERCQSLLTGLMKEAFEARV